MEPRKSKEDNPKQTDFFRDPPVRYLGYANELGEAFRSFVHVNIVRTSYVVASSYVIGDAAHKGRIAYLKFDGFTNRRRLVTQGVVDTLIWQGLASVIIPGFTINRICWFSKMVLTQRLSPTASKGLSTVMGLVAIPFIINPIDSGVDVLMNRSFRKWFNNMDKLDKNIIHHTRND